LSALFFVIGLLASFLGAACGIGGGVIIKPALDFFADAATVSFLSGCTVLAMSAYTTAKNAAGKERYIQWRVMLPLSIGAAAGGTAGKYAFQLLADAFLSMRAAGRIQAVCLAALAAGTLVYLLCRERVRPRQARHPVLCVLAGCALGMISGFLGIGGGPINLAVLCHFFGMNTKAAARNSVALICISQAAALTTILVTRSVPAFVPMVLLLMILGGILGGEAGRRLQRALSRKAMHQMLIALMGLIMGLSIYGALK